MGPAAHFFSFLHGDRRIAQLDMYVLDAVTLSAAFNKELRISVGHDFTVVEVVRQFVFFLHENLAGKRSLEFQMQ